MTKQNIAQIDPAKSYSLKEAISLAKAAAKTKFISSIELHLNTTEKNIKQNLLLPFSIGKQVRVAVANDATLEKIEKGVIDFDILLAEPAMMPRLAKYAKILGPKGLMPNPKNGTITTDLAKTTEQFQKGQIQLKTEADFPLIHQMVGKANQADSEIEANILAVIEAVKKSRIKSAVIKTTMGKALKLDLAKI